jgi:anti-sigma-K factor RskA
VDIKELIESGSLELYVMGSLPAEEMRLIDELRRTHPELNDEIARIEDAMIAYADSLAITPKADLKEKIAGKLNFTVGLDLEEERVSSIQIQMPGIYKAAAVVFVVLVLGFAATTGYFYGQYKSLNSRLIQLENEKTQLAAQVKQAVERSQNIKTQLAVVSDPANKTVELHGLDIAPAAKATVYWNKQAGTTFVDAAQLPATAANGQYQLWAIVDSKPVSLGVIAKDTLFQPMKAVKNATAFAITLEPLGGKATPTLANMYVMGKI